MTEIAIAPELKGAQAVHRALALLKVVTRQHEVGVTGQELIAETGFNRVTVARLLAALAAEGLVKKDAKRRYSLGIGAVQIGLAAMQANPAIQRCRPMMVRLAQKTEDTVFLLVRNGDHGQCVHHEEGRFPVKALVLRPGDLRLLGVGSAGIALMASLPDREIGAIHGRHRAEYPPALATVGSLMHVVAQARQNGYSSSDGLVTEGVRGVGVCFEILPTYRAAISVAAIAARMTAERRRWIAGGIVGELNCEGFAVDGSGSQHA